MHPILCLVFLTLVRSSIESPIEIIFPLMTESTESHSKVEEQVESVLESRESPDIPEDGETKENVREEREVSAAAVPESSEKPKLNILEVLKGMGNAFQLLMRQPNPTTVDTRGDSRADGQGTQSGEEYRQQAEHLRSEINKRSGQLQRVVAAAIEANKDKDIVVKRILENLQTRLGQAKLRADKILKEPESGELAVRTLNSINQGMGNLGNLVQHVLSRINISINFDLKDGVKSTAAAASTADKSVSSSQTSEQETPVSTSSSPAE